MKQGKTEKAVFAKLASQKVELAKADDILRDVSSLASLFLNSRNKLQNAGFDALQDYEKVEAGIKEQERAINDFKSAVKELGIDLPNEVETAEKNLQSMSTGLSRAKKIANEASKMQ
jgi:hypothetical protein